MANTRSAKKRIRQSAHRHSLNQWRKHQIKQAVRSFNEAVDSGDRNDAEQQLRAAHKTLDRVAAKGVIHKNAAARRKARLSQQLKEMAG